MGGRDDIVPGVEEGAKDQLLLVCAQLWKHTEKIDQEIETPCQRTGTTAGEHGGKRLVIAFVCKEEDRTKREG